MTPDQATRAQLVLAAAQRQVQETMVVLRSALDELEELAHEPEEAPV